MTSPFVAATTFGSFADLSRAYREGEDYRIICQPHQAALACIVAPHGGGIETHTSDIARAIAGTEFSLYLFEGLRPRQNFEALHLTSHRFDEPRCLQMLAHCRDVVTIHGCNAEGEVVLIGGLDRALAMALQSALTAAGLRAEVEGHAFTATNPSNICNRGRRAVGVQLELSTALRRSPNRHRLVTAVRDVLLRRGTAN